MELVRRQFAVAVLIERLQGSRRVGNLLRREHAVAIRVQRRHQWQLEARPARTAGRWRRRLLAIGRARGRRRLEFIGAQLAVLVQVERGQGRGAVGDLRRIDAAIVIGIQGRNERGWPTRRATAGTAGRRAGTRITAGILSREVQRAQAEAERDREQQWGCVHRLFLWGVVKRGRWPDRTLTMGLGLRPERFGRRRTPPRGQGEDHEDEQRHERDEEAWSREEQKQQPVHARTLQETRLSRH
jgi:hypothetical protein